jgi:hypothetical protein
MTWLNICVTNDHGYVPLVVNTSRSFPHSWLITRFVTKLTRRVPLVEQELLTLPEHLSSPPVVSGVRVTRSLVLSVCFVDRCLSFCTFSFGHCVVCSSSIYGFWLPLWYLQTLLIFIICSLVLFTSLGTCCIFVFHSYGKAWIIGSSGQHFYQYIHKSDMRRSNVVRQRIEEESRLLFSDY